MGSYSTSAPSLPTGASWSSYDTTGTYGANHYNVRTRFRIARGPEDTIYLHLQLQMNNQEYTPSTAGNANLQCSVLDEDGTFQSSLYTAYSDSYGSWTTGKTLYYTGRASDSFSVGVRAHWNSSSYTGWKYVSSPEYVTTYLISFVGNGNTSGSTLSQTKVYDHDINISNNGFIKGGYSFDHWNTEADDSGTRYDEGDSYSVNSDLLLYAIWIQSGSTHIVGKPLTVGKGWETKIDVLWENPSYSDTSTFAAQTITGQNLAGIQDYPLVLVKFRIWGDSGDPFCSFLILPIFNDHQTSNTAFAVWYTNNRNCQRKCSVLTDSMSFTAGRYNGSNKNNYLVPKTIYGVK